MPFGGGFGGDTPPQGREPTGGTMLFPPTPIVEIALTVGFQTQAHFTTIFKRFVGSTPNRWRAINQMPTGPGSRNGKGVDMAAAADRQGLADMEPANWICIDA